MVQEMHKFNNDFTKLQAELVVTKHVNCELCKLIVEMEHQCWANVQYSRRGCLDMVNDKLETKVLSIFQKVGCTIDPIIIDDCHSLTKNNGSCCQAYTP